MIQRGEIVEATVAEYGWAVKPNKHSRFENFWVTIGTELQVTHVRNDGMLNVRFAAVGMDRAVFRFDAAHVKQVRQVGVAPDGAIDPDHPGLAWLWEDAARLADRYGYCEIFDKITDELGVPGRERAFRIPMLNEDGIRITATVSARSRVQAERKIRERMVSAAPLALTEAVTS